MAESFVKNMEHAHKENGDGIVGLWAPSHWLRVQGEPVSGRWAVLG